LSLWLPPAANRDLQEQRLELTAEYLAQAQHLTVLKEWNKELKKIDERLELVWAPEGVDLPGLTPGRYHVIRQNPGGLPGVFVHEGDDGEFREPDSGLFQRLKSSDLWNDRVQRDRKKREKELERAAEKRKEQERADRMEEVLDRYRHKYVTKIAVDRNIS
jgi:hypothetical protein